MFCLLARGNVSKIVFGGLNQNILKGCTFKLTEKIVIQSTRKCSAFVKEDEKELNHEFESKTTEGNSQFANNDIIGRKRIVKTLNKEFAFERPRSWKSKFSPRHHERRITHDKHNEYSENQSSVDYDDDDLLSSRESETRRPYRDRYSNYGRNSDFDRHGSSDYNFKSFERPNREYKSFQKNFYREQQSVKERSQEEIQQFFSQHDIQRQGPDMLRPVTSFEEAGFPDIMLNKLARNGWTSPSPIQSITWPQALAGKDVVGIAQTGSGKTLGFLLPAFVHIQHQEPLQRKDGPICLVVVPTRELAQQVHRVALEYGKVCNIRSVACYGGEDRGRQLRTLWKGAEVCIGTPGRLNDFISSGELTLDRCTYLVLDEADRMLDMGFEPQIRQIIDQIRPDRQTLMWSATWPTEVQGLARDFLGDYVQINVGSAELNANKNITQEIIVCQEHEKFHKFGHILQKVMESNQDEKILVFAGKKSTADHLSYKLDRARIPNVCIHSDKSQNRREKALYDFRSGRANVMIATDVAARGLDVNDITYVINYDFPNTVEDYIHRIGRTGRADKSGTSVSFFTSTNEKLAKKLIGVLEDSNQDVSEELKKMLYLSSSRRGYSTSRYSSNRGQSGYRRHSDSGGYYRRGGFSRYEDNSGSYDRMNSRYEDNSGSYDRMKNKYKFAPGFTQLDD